MKILPLPHNFLCGKGGISLERNSFELGVMLLSSTYADEPCPPDPGLRFPTTEDSKAQEQVKHAEIAEAEKVVVVCPFTSCEVNVKLPGLLS